MVPSWTLRRCSEGETPEVGNVGNLQPSRREAWRLSQGGDSREGEEGSRSGCIYFYLYINIYMFLKVESAGFPKGPRVACERKRERSSQQEGARFLSDGQ